MSLDVYLNQTKELTCDCGKVHEIDTNKVGKASEFYGDLLVIPINDLLDILKSKKS